METTDIGLYTFPITRIYAGPSGDSFFEDTELDLADHGMIGFLSQKLQVRYAVFRKTGADYNYSFHTAPARQFVLLLSGTIEIETSLGEKRRFSGGDVLLLEDTTGKGHKTHTVDNQVRKSVFISLDD